MHGIVFTEFKQFFEKGSHDGRWHELLKTAGLDRHIYTSIRHYPDEEFFDIIDAASRITKKQSQEILEEFGTFIAPDLLGMYTMLIKPEWRTLDVIQHTEAVIHAVVRVNQVGSSPPQLNCRRVSVNEIEMIYDSPRKLCRLAKGIMRGIAAHYDERIEILEHRCMLMGDTACVLQIRQVTPKKSEA